MKLFKYPSLFTNYIAFNTNGFKKGESTEMGHFISKKFYEPSTNQLGSNHLSQVRIEVGSEILEITRKRHNKEQFVLFCTHVEFDTLKEKKNDKEWYKTNLNYGKKQISLITESKIEFIKLKENLKKKCIFRDFKKDFKIIDNIGEGAFAQVNQKLK